MTLSWAVSPATAVKSSEPPFSAAPGPCFPLESRPPRCRGPAASAQGRPPTALGLPALQKPPSPQQLLLGPQFQGQELTPSRHPLNKHESTNRRIQKILLWRHLREPTVWGWRLSLSPSEPPGSRAVELRMALFPSEPRSRASYTLAITEGLRKCLQEGGRKGEGGKEGILRSSASLRGVFFG